MRLSENYIAQLIEAGTPTVAIANTLTTEEVNLDSDELAMLIRALVYFGPHLDLDVPAVVAHAVHTLADLPRQADPTHE